MKRYEKHQVQQKVAVVTGNSMMKDRYNQMAREVLPEEEYQRVQHLLEI